MLDADYTTRTVILLVEDPKEVEILEQAVAEFGHSTVHVQCENDLRHALHQESTIAAILDFSRGAAAATDVRTCAQTRPGLPFVAIVPEERREATVEALRMGAHACLRRPLHGEEVVFSVGNLLASVSERYNASGSFSDMRRVEIPNDFDLVTPLAKSIVDTTLSPIDVRRNHVILGLVELLNNAIEHGNLEIDYQEKNHALKGSYFYRLATEKSRSEPWASRKVVVEASQNASDGWITYRIVDEGKGFDWRDAPNPLEGEGVEARHGRGILMARHSFDSMEYNEKGNEVTVRLRIHPEGGNS
jgi:DNA-binding response OmpR family regulator